MVATARFLGTAQGFIPEATGQVISYVRDPKEFKVNQYTQSIKSPKPQGFYFELDRDQPARVVTDAEWAWEDGDPAPVGNTNLGNFRAVIFKCERRAYPFTLGWQALETATGWKPKDFHLGIVSQQAMTNRTKRFVDLMETSSNWGANTATATALSNGAGYWNEASNDVSSPNYLAIKKSLLEAVRRINLASNSKVKPDDLLLVLSPGLAILMSETSEIHDYLSKSPFALAQVRGDKPGQNQLWGLPDQLYGIKIVVEDAVEVVERANAAGTNATANRTYVKADTSACLVSRPGGIDGNYGSPSYSTLQRYFYDFDLTVEAYDDTPNKRLQCRVLDHFKEVLAAAPTGFLLQETVAA